MIDNIKSVILTLDQLARFGYFVRDHSHNYKGNIEIMMTAWFLEEITKED